MFGKLMIKLLFSKYYFLSWLVILVKGMKLCSTIIIFYPLFQFLSTTTFKKMPMGQMANLNLIISQ